jgi:nucleoside-diphosphate-sugar epimerase
MRIVITGAAGNIASAVIKELSRFHELCLIDRRPVEGVNSYIADLSIAPRDADSANGENWSSVFENAEAVVHLAANRESLAPWEKVLPDNIQATWNVLEAGARHRVSRVVFASSNWAVKALEQQLAPACYEPGGPKISSEAFPCPVNAYGLSKAFGELAGRMFVHQQQLQSFVAVRIGNFNPAPSEDKVVRTRWIGVEDMRSLIRRCVEAEFSGFHVVYGVSAQPTTPYDLTQTRALLGWQPRQMP